MHLHWVQSVVATLICAVALVAACCADEVRADRPLYWLSGDHTPAGASFRRALSVPGIRRPLQEMDSADVGAIYLDMSRSFGVRDKADFQSKAYEVLDALISTERRLEEGWKSADRTNERYGAAYYFLKYRLRFAEALAKAEISRRMADTGAASYCTQAMESAIDCLKASAEARDEFEKLKEPQGYGKVTDLPASTIREFREGLLRIWHSSKSQGDLTPITEVDTWRLLNQSTARTIKDTKARKAIEGLFARLETSPAGNHHEAASVE